MKHAAKNSAVNILFCQLEKARNKSCDPSGVQLGGADEHLSCAEGWRGPCAKGATIALLESAVEASLEQPEALKNIIMLSKANPAANKSISNAQSNTPKRTNIWLTPFKYSRAAYLAGLLTRKCDTEDSPRTLLVSCLQFPVDRAQRHRRHS